MGTVLLDHPPQTCGWRSDERFGSSATRIAMHYLSWGTPAPFGIATFRRALVTDRSELAAVPAQIAELLSKLTDDLTVWDSIPDRYDLDLFAACSCEQAMKASPSIRPRSWRSALVT